jgi:hypothetical protein
LLQIVIDCKLRVSFIIRIEGVESNKIFNAVQHKRVKMILFNSVYTYAKEELGLNDTDALTLAQFIVDNQYKLTTQEKHMKYTDYYSATLMKSKWLAKVSHHYYWFDSFEELVSFQNSSQFDIRMTIAHPTNS